MDVDNRILLGGGDGTPSTNSVECDSGSGAGRDDDCTTNSQLVAEYSAAVDKLLQSVGSKVRI